MDSTPRTPSSNPFLTAARADLDVMQRYRETCPQCGASVSSFRIERDAGMIVYTVQCASGHRTIV